MRNSLKIATVGGIGIYLHISWLLAFAFMTWTLGDYYQQKFASWNADTAYLIGAISAALLFVTVLIHELSHSFTARAHGLPVRQITLFIFGGAANLTQEPRSPRSELLITLAGPLASLVLSGIFFALYVALAGAPSEVTAVLHYLAYVNLLLALFNLIPGLPLDGGRVLRAILWFFTGSLRRATHIAARVGQAIGYLFIFGGLFEAFVLGQVFGGIWLAFIGWFLNGSAGASYQQAVVDQMLVGVEVQDVMDRRLVSAPPTASVELLAYDYMLGQNWRAMPIAGPDGRLLGLVTMSDLGKVPRERWPMTPVSQIMTPASELCTVSPFENLRDALRTLAENDYHQLPVTQDGTLVGILYRGQVLQYLHLRQQLASQQPSAVSRDGRPMGGTRAEVPPEDQRDSVDRGAG